MRRSNVLALGFLAGCAGQSADASQYDASVAALCSQATGTAPGAPTSANIVQQPGGTTVRVTAPGGTPDALYVKDEYGTILGYTANTGSAFDVPIGANTNELMLHAHYTSCHTTMVTVSTWAKKVNDFQSSDAGDAYTATQIASVAPTFSAVNYPSRSATFSFDQQPGVGLQYAYAKGPDGVIIAFAEFSAPPGSTQATTLGPFTIPDLATQITACTLSCVDHSLTAALVLSIENANPTEGALVISPTLAGQTLTVGPTAACANGVYQLYATSASSALLGFGTSRPLVVDVTGLSSITVKQHCSNALSSVVVSLEPMRAVNQAAADAADAAAAASPDSQTRPLTCDFGGRTYSSNAVWNDGDRTCSCVQGRSECGGGAIRGVYLNSAQIVGVCISAFVMFAVIGACAYFYRMQKMAEQIHEGRRRSHSGQAYRGSVTMKHHGQAEVELPSAQA